MNHQSDQLASNENHSPFMAMLAGFVVFFLEEGGIFPVTPLDRESGFTEVVAQVSVSLARERCFFGLEFSRAGLAPPQTGELGNLVLVVVEAFGMPDLGDDACGEHRAE